MITTLLIGVLFGAAATHVAWLARQGLYGWGWAGWLYDMRCAMEFLIWREGKRPPTGSVCLAANRARPGGYRYDGCPLGYMVTQDEEGVTCPVCLKRVAAGNLEPKDPYPRISARVGYAPVQAPRQLFPKEAGHAERPETGGPAGVVDPQGAVAGGVWRHQCRLALQMLPMDELKCPVCGAVCVPPTQAELDRRAIELPVVHLRVSGEGYVRAGAECGAHLSANIGQAIRLSVRVEEITCRACRERAGLPKL